LAADVAGASNHEREYLRVGPATPDRRAGASLCSPTQKPSDQEAMMNGSQLLHDAGDLVERGWCQGTEARDANGDSIDVTAAAAASWSLLGALQATTVANPNTELQDIGDAVSALAELIVDPSLANWNDSETRTKLEVLSVLRDAEVMALEQLVYHELSEN
jgi:hypothetical protein